MWFWGGMVKYSNTMLENHLYLQCDSKRTQNGTLETQFTYIEIGFGSFHPPDGENHE